MKTKKIACLGAGPIGGSWAIVFAQAGYDVCLYDNDDKAAGRARDIIADSLFDLKEEGLVVEERLIQARIQNTSSLAEAVGNAGLVIESIIEDVEVKRSLFKKLVPLTLSETLITSSTSSIPGSLFMDHPDIRERCLIAHPVNPPHLIPVVEICATPWTARRTHETCHRLMEQVGLRPINIKKEIPAFVVNRLQAALIGESMHLVDQGIVSVEDLDIAVKHGFGRRLAFTGPFESLHLNSSLSFKSYWKKYKKLIKHMIEVTNVKHSWSEGLLEKIADERDRILPPEKIEARKRWRNHQLMRIQELWDRAEKTEP